MPLKSTVQLRNGLAVKIKSSSDSTVDILDPLTRRTRTALELVSQGGIGHAFNSFDKDRKKFHNFHEALKDVM
jgi:hypothetical protein